ncbi:hypothetical protein GGR57DRAFT_413767 [Xylariaceae sp. FL1272]|nr:hypothetical protein GGR57DRAFT_413767 [Xylariaceae sp. FL1272]
MGLASQKNKRKLDFDPNNTRWTRDETTFGQKILRSQGWEPGKFLGAQDSPHAELHSAASFAPIKINLKDDTLGLGAKILAKQNDECTGLDVFKDLLGRLNGKSEVTLEKERLVRSEIKTNLYVERKYGPMRFVSGGLLVGDQQKMAELAKANPSTKPTKDETYPELDEAKSLKKQKKDKKSKKRKAEESGQAGIAEDAPKEKRKKYPKANASSDNDIEFEDSLNKRAKEGKKSKKSQEPAAELDSEKIEPERKRKKSKKPKDTSNDSTETLEIIESDKATKKDKKKKEKREKKRKQRDDESTANTTTSASTTTTIGSTPHDSGSSTPLTTGTSTPTLSARHRARSRHIASKRQAFGDMTALNQIFMVKPV